MYCSAFSGVFPSTAPPGCVTVSSRFSSLGSVSEVAISRSERAYLEDGISASCRLDGRALLDYRPLTIEVRCDTFILTIRTLKKFLRIIAFSDKHFTFSLWFISRAHCGRGTCCGYKGGCSLRQEYPCFSLESLKCLCFVSVKYTAYLPQSLLLLRVS